MTVTNFSKARKIPTSATTKKSSPTTTNFAKGIFTYKPNDTMDFDEIYLAQNARFDRIGEYATRRGIAPFCEPVGKATEQTPSPFPVTDVMKDVDQMELTVTTTKPIYSIKFKVAAKNDTDYGVMQATLLDEDDEVVAVSCVNNVTTTPTTKEFIFRDGPKGTFKVVLGTQGLGTQKYQVAYRPMATIPDYYLYTADEGKVIGLFEANIEGAKVEFFAFKDTGGTTKLYYTQDGGAPQILRTLPNGVEKVRFSQNQDEIRYADGQEGPRKIVKNPLIGPLTPPFIDSAITTLDLKTDTDLEIKTSNILTGTQDNIIYFDADTTTQAVWTYPSTFQYAPQALFSTTGAIAPFVPGETTTSTFALTTLEPLTDEHGVADIAEGDIITDEDGNYGTVASFDATNVTVTSISNSPEPINSYDKFDRDFRQNFPAVKTGDPLTAMFNLGGVVYFLTRHNKYYLYSQTADVWTQQASSAQHGTFSQESCVCDLNYAYYANDDGVYIFDGSSEASITQNSIQKTYDAIKGKESIALELYNNRLYVFYSSQGNGTNDGCLVYNINLRLWESFDTGLPVAISIARQTASNRFICGSSKFGQLYSFETENNGHADLGAPIAFDLETSYLHFGTPSQLHRITKWRPEFATVDGDYTIKCGYALDFTDDVKYVYSIDLKNKTILHEDYEWDNPPTYGNPVRPTKLSTIPQINGQFYRCQIRYQNHEAFTPVNFKAQTLSVETQRLR